MKIPDGVDWLIWRPVVAGYASLREVEQDWSLDDCLDCALIDAAIERAKR